MSEFTSNLTRWRKFLQTYDYFKCLIFIKRAIYCVNKLTMFVQSPLLHLFGKNCLPKDHSLSKWAVELDKNMLLLLR
jgi:hypothetical protein